MEQLQSISVERLGIPSMRATERGGGQLGHLALGPKRSMYSNRKDKEQQCDDITL